MQSILLRLTLLCAVLITPSIYAQDTLASKFPKDWYNLDPREDSVLGVSTHKAYQVLEGKTAQPVIVAVIDSGVDTEHEDLQGSLWVNEGEIAGNGIDDDGNGYVDDIHGWNFIGNPNGENIEGDSYELTREYKRLTSIFEQKDSLKIRKKQKALYPYYKKVKKAFERQKKKAEEDYNDFYMFATAFSASYDYLTQTLQKDTIILADIEPNSSDSEKTKRAKTMTGFGLEVGMNQEQLQEGMEYFDNLMGKAYNLAYDPRPLVGDNYEDINEKFYGNSDVKGPDASHGTHVAGIIAAQYNNIGINGICKTAKIMCVRAVPNGDERDKDILNAIYYAVDNGAQIINMSFGKSYSPHKDAIDKAVQYAEKKGVLFVHAAGNSAKNLDKKDNFPSRTFTDGRNGAKHWIEVGASSWGRENEYVGSFSNYGANRVDVFAPGVEITSTTPDHHYTAFDGTSMAAPVVSGIGALLMAYYPELSAQQVKDVILQSSRKYGDLQVKLPSSGDQEPKQVTLKDLCNTGGVVNAYDAVKMAESRTVEGKQ